MKPKPHPHIPSKTHTFQLEGCLVCGHFDGNVELYHRDGTTLLWNHAFWTFENARIVVYTEHCGYHAFSPHGWSVNIGALGPAKHTVRKVDMKRWGVKPFPKNWRKRMFKQRVAYIQNLQRKMQP